jgi:5-methylcytosine-specific restriction enzyme A
MFIDGFIDKRELAKEKQKARDLRQTQWWKMKLSTGLCHYCEQKFTPQSLTMDHVVPLSRGGKSSKNNTVPSCKECNNKKKYYTPTELILMGSTPESAPE